MNNKEGSSIAIKGLVTAGIVCFIVTVIAINFISKDEVYSLAKTTNTKDIVENNKVNVEDTSDLTTDEIVNKYEETKIASVTSRSGDDYSRTNEQVTPIEGEEENNYITIDEVSISRDMDLTVRTGLSKQDFKMLIGNTKQDSTKFFYDNSDLIYDVCEKYEINEIFFCGLIAGESGWNVVPNHRRTYNYISLMVNGRLKQFSSVEDGLEQAAKTLHENYLSENGRFYCGKTLNGVKTRFCPNSTTWVNLIYKCMGHMVKNK